MSNAAKNILKITRILEQNRERFARLDLADGVHVSVMNGKLNGMKACSTSAYLDPICRYRILHADEIEDRENMPRGSLVCRYCYSTESIANYQGLREWLEYNTNLLTQKLLTREEARFCAHNLKTADLIARIEAHGDTMNVTQARNYIRIIFACGCIGISVGVWTKNPGIWKAAIAIEGRPDNMTFILSSRFVNAPDYDIARRYDFIDCVFTVYDNEQLAEYAIASGAVRCMCGKDSCRQHRFCYSYRRKPNEPVKNIVELLRK